MASSLLDHIHEAEKNHRAIGHFNVSNLEGVWAVVRAMQKLQVPAVIGVSEGERDFIGSRQVVALIKSIREEYDLPLFLNADHTYSFDKVAAAVDAGFDSVIFDGAKLSFDENVKTTKQCVQYAREKGSPILIEGELGYIGQSSKVLDEIPEGVKVDAVTKEEDARRFVEETGVSLLAPAIGNFHGMLKSGDEPLHIEAVKGIRQAAGVPLVLHGGSGISDDDFRKVIQNGIAMVHVSTELRVAFRKGLVKALGDDPDEVAPYKYLKTPLKAMEEVVEAKLKLFNHL